MRAVYAGSFDPITLGHVSVIERAFQLFSEVHIIVANNRSKKHHFTIEQRTELVALSVPKDDKIHIIPYEGIVADYINEHDINVVIRGIRNATDLEYELQLEQYIRNTTLADTIYLSPYTHYMQTSSSLVRMFLMSDKTELAASYMVPKAYAQMLDYVDYT
ncbi:pantetheine-phosphate adenylyltransferase [Paenibacillus sp. FSL A5-0031]|uniref:pantetheine-phosphate adenylyltransferase n=1 Tax=unclassified Paenibacillus TaxID=185978 RepID=UPI00096D7BFF|nr:pantetheine-phosphate adenylyltransferase [Paenibacillus sp. FSL A5-0031]OME86946.1 pantetheine-phosphate adenylyltransferase [Paenibacillus sp. FSL A5-0031]